MSDFRHLMIDRLTAHDDGFAVRGLLGFNDRLYPLGSDSKVLSTVFELLVRPALLEAAECLGMVVEESPQTVYPDFTLSLPGRSNGRIAVDVKTTYRRRAMGFTLGSYTSFLRDGSKNIKYPYSEYGEHWVVGFVYDRVELPSRVAHPPTWDDVPICPYTNVEWFVQEKFRIAGERPGSGNTANIGSIIASSIVPFRDGTGPFAELGEEVFRDYWAGYGVARDSRPYSSVQEFLRLRGRAP